MDKREKPRTWKRWATIEEGTPFGSILHVRADRGYLRAMYGRKVFRVTVTETPRRPRRK